MRTAIAPSALSIEVTNMCNLRCKHCFWENYKVEIPQRTDSNIIDSVRKILNQYRSITNIIWYGGEPLLNDETTRLVRRGIDELGIKNNMVITNGIHGIPIWHDKTTFFGVSVDGTEKAHNAIRGHKTYQKTKANVLAAVAAKTPVSLIYCLNAYNVECVGEFLREWSGTGIRGVVFTIATPLRGKTAAIDLTDLQRDALVPLLLEQKAIHGDFIYNSELMIELLHSKYSEKLAQNCLMNRNNTEQRVHSIHMRNDGSIQTPCALGPDADCLKCRSVTHVALFAGKYQRDRESLLALFRMYHAKYQTSERPHPDGSRGRDVFSALGSLKDDNGPPASRRVVRLPLIIGAQGAP
jgi:sulfatase maturation enzyme AslB (radical SAM superfamily)